MNIRKPEIFAVAATALFLAFVLGFFAGAQNKGDSITVRTRYDDASEAAETDTANIADSGEEGEAAAKVNINTAGPEELMGLPHIGEVTAGRIIDYREKYGDFRIIEEITDVNGIGEKIFDAIKDLITVEENPQ